jgi:glycosyltransferase involved in cell wall biosynthesis
MKIKPGILYIGNKLAAHGYTPGNIDTLGPLLELEGYTMYYSSSKLNKLSRLADMLTAIWRYRSKVDVVLIDTFSTPAFYFAWLCGLLCSRLNMKYIPILRGGNLPYRMRTSPAKCRQLFGNSWKNIAVSAYLQNQLRDMGLPSLLIPNHIELNNYPFKKRAVLSPKLLWVRAFHKTYNPKMAIEVTAELLKNNPSLELTMVGPDLDGSMQQCKQLAVILGVEKHIRFTGKLSKKDWIALAHEVDIFINTTDYDNLPVSVIEAMALGLPVVSTNAGGVPFLIENGVNAFMVNIGDAQAMAAKVQHLLNDSTLAHALSVNARSTSTQFDWQLLKVNWHGLLKDLH